jgi:hypothetical protein
MRERIRTAIEALAIGLGALFVLNVGDAAGREGGGWLGGVVILVDNDMACLMCGNATCPGAGPILDACNANCVNGPYEEYAYCATPSPACEEFGIREAFCWNPL